MKNQYQKCIGITCLVLMRANVMKKLQKTLSDNGIDYETFDDQVVYSPGTIKTKEDKPYSVFTPFKRRWIENFNLDLLDIEFNYTAKNDTGISSNVNEFNFEFKKLILLICLYGVLEKKMQCQFYMII